MTALYVLAVTQLLALIVALDVAWREYHPARRAVTVITYGSEYADTLTYATEPVSVPEFVLTFFKVIDDAGRPRVVWA